MIALLEIDDLVMEARDHPIAHTAGYRFVAPSGDVLGWLEERAGTARRLGRQLAHRPGQGPANLDLVDPNGAAILGVEKSKVSAFGKVHVEVRLADATVLGFAEGRVVLRTVIGLHNPAGHPIAEMRGGSGARYELVDPHGTAIGTLARQLFGSQLPPEGVWRSYQISFSPSAGIAVRALAIATLASIDMRHL